MNPSIPAALATISSGIGGGITISVYYQKNRSAKERISRHWIAEQSAPSINLKGHSSSKDLIEGLTARSRWLKANYTPHIALAAIGLFVLSILSRSWSVSVLSFLAFLSGLTLAVAFPVVNDQLRKAKITKAIDANLALDIEKMAVYLSAGLSITSAIARLSKNSTIACRALFEDLNLSLASGVELSEALAILQITFNSDSLHRFCIILESGLWGGNLPRAARHEAQSQRVDAHRQALALMEKNSQKIWIPITIAALVPGIILIFIPFLSILRTVSG
jgi:Flp pilus assembly protein TadB